MNRWVITAALAVLLSGAGLAPAEAAERTTDALLACANESDDAQRLHCFDAVVVALRKAPAPVARGGRRRRLHLRRSARGHGRAKVRCPRRHQAGQARGPDRADGDGHGARHEAPRRADRHARQRPGVGRDHDELEDQAQDRRHGEDRARARWARTPWSRRTDARARSRGSGDAQPRCFARRLPAEGRPGARCCVARPAERERVPGCELSRRPHPRARRQRRMGEPQERAGRGADARRAQAAAFHLSHRPRRLDAPQSPARRERVRAVAARAAAVALAGRCARHAGAAGIAAEPA